MKKSLVLTLALVFVLGIAGTAFAANPFVDVPANHWAYGSIAKLAQGGIIDGYGDGTFVGNNTMTRYEMAQIVAKAMARSDKADAAQKAQIEKLAAEFADELDALGVRVAKLEKYADKVKITGEARFGYWAFDKDAGKTTDKGELRSRIWLNGEVNDRWNYVGMFENTQNFKTNVSEGTVNLRRAWVQGKIGEVGVKAGRFNYTTVNGVVIDNEADGLLVSYSANNWKFDAFAIRPVFSNSALQNLGVNKTLANPDGTSNNQVYGAVIGADFNKLNATAAYYRTDATADGGQSSNIYEIALGYKFDDKWSLWAEYLRGSKEINDGGKSGWAARVDYGKLVRSKPGTFNIRAAYYDVPGAATIDTTPELDFGAAKAYDGYKGWQVGASVMLAKNIDFNVDYFDFEAQKADYDNTLLWTYVRFYF